MDAALTIKTEFNGGLLSGVLKKFFGGESLFVNRFTNPTRQSLQVVLSQSTIGELPKLKSTKITCAFNPVLILPVPPISN